MRNFSKFLKYAIFTGIFAVPFLVLVVAPNLFFPFITGKNFLFRFIVEIILSLWILLAYLDKSYRPKKSFILWSALALLFVLTLSTFFGENIRRSFWSNFERMEGLIAHFHLFAYFLVLGSVLKKDKEWFWFFHTSIGVSLIVSIYAILQLTGKLATHQGSRLDATLGNATYLAIYIVFHLFFILFYLFRSKNLGLRSFYVSAFIFESVILYYTATRGAIIGFLGGVILLSLLGVIFTKSRRRFAGIGALLFLIIIVSLFFAFRNSERVQNSLVLSRFASLSFQERTVESRFLIWNMGFEGFKEKPILGWGPDNYNLVFNNYFKPALWRQEPWFDRSHNIIFDWLVSAGILGLLAYLSLSFFAVWYAWKNYKKGVFSFTGASVIIALISVYFFHNLFVFDNIVSYILFFSVLAFIHSRYAASGFDAAPGFSFNKAQDKDRLRNLNQRTGIIYLTSFVIIGFVFVVYFVNVPGYLTAKTLIEALKAGGTGDLNAIYDKLDKSLKYNSFGGPEAREQLAGVTTKVLNSPQVSQDIKDKFFARAEEEFIKQVKEAPTDARYYIFLGALYNARGQYDEAVSALEKGVELAPKKQQIYFELGDAHFKKGDMEKAVEVLRRAYDFDNDNPQAALNLAIVLIVGGKEREGLEVLGKLEEKYGSKILADEKLVQAFFRAQDFVRASLVMEKLIEKDPDSFNYRTMAASLYYTIGRYQEAIDNLEIAVELNPSFKEQAEVYLKELKALIK